MKLTSQLRAIAHTQENSQDRKDILVAADVIDFVCGQMQSMSWHMDGTASYRFAGGWPLSSVRANGAEDALLKCVQMVKEEETRRINESR